MIKKKSYSLGGKIRKFPNGGIITGYDDSGNPIYDSPNPTTAQPKVASGNPINYANVANTVGNLGASELSTFEKQGTANVGLKTGEGVLKGAGEGALLGSAVPVIGTAAGAVVGAVVGGVSSFFNAKRRQKELDIQNQQSNAKLRATLGANSNAELAQYPVQGVTNAQYYANGGYIKSKYNQKNGTYYSKGGIIDRYIKRMDEGGIPDGGPGSKTSSIHTPTLSTGTIGFPAPNDPYWKLHPLWTEHTDGSYRQWGETPNVLDTRTLRQKLGNAVLNEPSSSTIPTPIVNGTGDMANPAMIQQRKGPVVQSVPSTSGYYAQGGQVLHRRGYSKMPISNYGSTIIDPDQLEYNPTQTDANYNYAKGGRIHKQKLGVGVPAPTYNSIAPNPQMEEMHDNTYAQGGTIPNPQYEAEKDEVVQGNPLLEQSNQLASDMHQVGGDTHENGGTMGIGGDRVFSDRLKVSPELLEILKESKISVNPNDTYANAATKLGKLKGKMEDKTSSGFQPSINTGKKTLDRINEATDALFQDQEMQKVMTTKQPTYAMGGKIPPRYNTGGDLELAQAGVPQPTIDDSRIQPFSYQVPELTPDVHPSFGQKVLDDVSKATKNNSGEITNFASYLANLGSIHQLDTTVKRNYLSPPVYNYANRSGEAIAQNQRSFNTSLKALTGSSRGVNASNAGALYASTLENNSKLANTENMRRDAYNESYSQRADRINEFNTVTGNQASDAQRDLNNNKNVTLPLQARNAWLQGVMANQQVKAQQRADKVKMALALASNDQNGVMSRFLKNYNNGGKEKIADLLKSYGFGDE